MAMGLRTYKHGDVDGIRTTDTVFGQNIIRGMHNHLTRIDYPVKRVGLRVSSGSNPAPITSTLCLGRLDRMPAIQWSEYRDEHTAQCSEQRQPLAVLEL
jgi:hypothetical protein